MCLHKIVSNMFSMPLLHRTNHPIVTCMVLLSRRNFSQRSSYNDFWRWTTTHRPNWMTNFKEGIIACSIFAATGSTTLVVVRPLLKSVLGLDGSLLEGPNSYRIASVLFVSPVYALLLGAFGTLAGRHNFFAKMSFKILNRFVPKSVLQKVVCESARQKGVK